jgi:hypothetical protein
MNEGCSVAHIAVAVFAITWEIVLFPNNLRTQCCEIAANSQLFENKILQLQELSK